MYFNAHENHNETFKVIEDAISQSGANVSKVILIFGTGKILAFLDWSTSGP
jgi:hypothetical protein